jgi:aspartyl-tRNA(Asn)/glutamyl-tRNA(Gln) amidotransferase subunit A
MDCALVLQEIAGHDAKDPLSAAAPIDTYANRIGKAVNDLKVGLIGSYYENLMVGNIRHIFSTAVKLLESLGMKTEAIDSSYTRCPRCTQWSAGRNSF